MNALVGYTGFVGSNILLKGKIDKCYNSSNIKDAYGLQPDLLIYAGVKAEKYLANNAPEEDMKSILQAQENIKRINPKKLVLISTIDVFKKPVNVDERTPIDGDGLQAYGRNRYMLECWVRENFEDALIIRLPGLFGKNLKKNFIFDIINEIPTMLTMHKFHEFLKCDRDMLNYYDMQENGFFRVKDLCASEKAILRKKLYKIGFSAKNFTDSRSIYQFYPLDRLWDDINIALDNNIFLLHMATEPISAGELFEQVMGTTFSNLLDATPCEYNYKTCYAGLFQGEEGYIYTKKQIVAMLSEFVKEHRAYEK